jgi:cytoskeletal protein CcmA (bactofilin family)
MKRILLTFAAIIGFILTSNAQTVKNYDYQGFDGLDISHWFDVEVIRGNTYSIVIEVSDDLEKYLLVKDSKGTLTIGLDNPSKKVLKNQNKLARATITMPVLTKLTLSGASKFHTNDQFDCGKNRFVMKLSGASLVYGLNVVAKETQISINGASTVRDIKGDFLEADIKVSGASKLYGNISADELDIEISGASKAEVNGEFEKVDLECSGASKALLSGTADEVSLEGSGVSSIVAEDMKVKDAEIDLSGTAKASIYVTRRLDVECSGASSCAYKADKSISITSEVSRGSSLRRID